MLAVMAADVFAQPSIQIASHPDVMPPGVPLQDVNREHRSWCQERESNPRPKAYESSALPLSYPGDGGDGNKPSAPAEIQPKLLHPAFSCPPPVLPPSKLTPFDRPRFGFKYYGVLAPALVTRYQSSTFFRAHAVFRRNSKLELMLGLCVKHRIRMVLPISSQP